MTSDEGPVAPPLIRLTGVRRTFDTESSAGVRDASLEIYAGDFVTILGPSGAGKSTLLNVLGLLDRPNRGEYLLDGESVEGQSERKRDELRSRYFGFVFQSAFVLGDETTLHNAAIGLRIQGINLHARSELAYRALQRVGIGHRAQLAAKNLSGGERQRLAIARAVATNPAVVLADEPTGNLDSTNGQIVIDYLRALNDAGTTIIVVTHDEDIARFANRVFRVSDGLVAELPAQSKSHHDVKISPPPRRNEQPISWLGSLLDDLGDTLSAMSNRVLRTLLLVLAFALGVGGLISSIGISETASAQVSERLSQAALDEVRVTLPGGSSLLASTNDDLNNWMERVAKLPHVNQVGYIADAGATSANIRRLSPSEPESQAAVLLATVSPSLLDLNDVGPAVPDVRSLLGEPTLKNVAVVGPKVVEALGLATPGPGSTLWVNNRRVDVIGELSSVGRLKQLQNTVLVSPDILAGSPTVVVTMVVRTDFGFPAAVAEAIPLTLDATDPSRFDVQTVADLRNLRFGVSSDLGSYVGILAGILLVLATIGAATTMSLSVQARAQEIALRRAIGLSRIGVSRLFLLEGLVVGLIGGVLGSAIGTAAVFLGAQAQGWTPVLTPGLAPLSLAIGLATGLCSAAIPAWRASRQEPASAIRG